MVKCTYQHFAPNKVQVELIGDKTLLDKISKELPAFADYAVVAVEDEKLKLEWVNYTLLNPAEIYDSLKDDVIRALTRANVGADNSGVVQVYSFKINPGIQKK